jgi:Spy/CpxP family protein refolding chaperone
MKESNMKRVLIGVGVAASVLMAGLVAAQPYGMGPGSAIGPGMVGAFGGDSYVGVDLTPEQRSKIAEIRQAASKAQWQLMGAMQDEGYRMHGVAGPGAFDEAAARKSFEAMTETRKAMFELQVETRRKTDAVLTPQQREQLRRYWTTR